MTPADCGNVEFSLSWEQISRIATNVMFLSYYYCISTALSLHCYCMPTTGCGNFVFSEGWSQIPDITTNVTFISLHQHCIVIALLLYDHCKFWQFCVVFGFMMNSTPCNKRHVISYYYCFSIVCHCTVVVWKLQVEAILCSLWVDEKVHTLQQKLCSHCITIAAVLSGHCIVIVWQLQVVAICGFLWTDDKFHTCQQTLCIISYVCQLT